MISRQQMISSLKPGDLLEKYGTKSFNGPTVLKKGVAGELVIVIAVSETKTLDVTTFFEKTGYRLLYFYRGKITSKYFPSDVTLAACFLRKI